MRAQVYGSNTQLINSYGVMQLTSSCKLFKIAEEDLAIFDSAFYSTTGTVDAFLNSLCGHFNKVWQAISVPSSEKTEQQSGYYNASNSISVSGITNDMTEDIVNMLDYAKEDGIVGILDYDLNGYVQTVAGIFTRLTGSKLIGTLPTFSKTYYIKYDKLTKIVTSITESEPTLPYVRIDIQSAFGGFDNPWTASAGSNSFARIISLDSDSSIHFGVSKMTEVPLLVNMKRLGFVIDTTASTNSYLSTYQFQHWVQNEFIGEASKTARSISLRITLNVQQAEVQEIFAKI